MTVEQKPPEHGSGNEAIATAMCGWRRIAALGLIGIGGSIGLAASVAADAQPGEPPQIKYFTGAALESNPSKFHLDLLQRGDQIQRVRDSEGQILSSPSGNWQYVGAIKRGEQSVSRCGWILAENIEAFDLKILPSSNSNPCTVHTMNEQKQPSTFIRKMNCPQVDPEKIGKSDGERNGCTDGTSGTSQVNTRPGCSRVSFYRDPERTRKVGVLRRGAKIHFRFIFKEIDAASIRIDMDDLEGSELLTQRQRDMLRHRLWGFAKPGCLNENEMKNGTKNHVDTVPGKNPNSKRKEYQSAKS